MRYYYTDAQNRPTGPVELEQLQQLQTQGTITPQSYVIPEGGTQWISYGFLLSSLAPAATAPAATATQPPSAPATPPPAAQPSGDSAKPTESPAPAPQASSGKTDNKAQPAPVSTPTAPAAPAQPPKQPEAAPAKAAEPKPGPAPVEQPAAAPAQQQPTAASKPEAADKAPTTTPAVAKETQAAPARTTAPAAAAQEPTPTTAAARPAPATTPPPQAAPAPNPIELISSQLAQFIDLVLKTARATLTESLLRRLLALFTRGGYVLVLVGAALGLVQSIVAGIRLGTFGGFMTSLGTGIVALAAVAILQYVAFRFFAANETLVKSNPSRVGSAAILDCLALVLLVGAFAALVGGVFACFAASSPTPFIPGLLVAALQLFAAGIALNPALCNIELKESSAGEEAIGLASFVGKASLVAQPILFGVLALGGTIAICAALFRSSAADSLLWTLHEIPAVGLLAGAGGSAFLILACLIPALYHLGFLVLYLHLDLLRAILGLPRQLRDLQR